MSGDKKGWISSLFETPLRFLSDAKKAIADNVVGVVILLSLVSIGIGHLISGKPLAWGVDGINEGVWLIEGGKIALGAGVFAVIIKSRQFLGIFKEQIYSVVFAPENYKTRKELAGQWLLFSGHMLKDILPEKYAGATKRILKQFFNEELEYHFEDYVTTYDIKITGPDNVSVTHTSCGNIICSPHSSTPKIKQYIKSGSSKPIALKKLFIDESEIPEESWDFVDDPDSPDTKVFTYHLNASKQKVWKFERTYEYEQDLLVEPYFNCNIERYVRGYKVKVKAPSGYNVVFRKYGVGEAGDLPSKVDGNGYRVWVLSKGNELLIPGQGYIVILVKEGGTKI